MDQISILDLVEKIPDEASAYEFMEQMRWSDKPICPHCGSINDHHFLTPENGLSRRTRTGTHSQRRVWKCRDCKKQFSVITNTPFHGSKVPLRIWVFVLFEMCANKNGIAAREVARKYKLTNKTAWFVTHRVRLAMEAISSDKPMTGIVVADETWIGGNPSKMNKERRARLEKEQGVEPGHYLKSKQPVLSLIGSRSGEARSRVVTDVRGDTLRKVISQQVDTAASELHTDESNAYARIGPDFTAHRTVNHHEKQYMHNGATTNPAENYFSQLKRSLDGTHHNVSRNHLQRYLNEFDFRYSTRQLTDTERMGRLMGQTAGRRLTYRRLNGD